VDLLNEPARGQLATLAGSRTQVLVPLLKDGRLVGAMVVFRKEVRPFTDKQIDLLKNFAAQAVIAIENARLLNELRQRTTDLTERTADLTEALDQQTATSEVLEVISRSPGGLDPVFQAMLEKAVRICDAKFGSILRWDNEAAHLVATHNAPPAFAEERRRSQNPADPKTSFGRMVAHAVSGGRHATAPDPSTRSGMDWLPDTVTWACSFIVSLNLAPCRQAPSRLPSLP
jgi:hypothetical protein